MHSSDQFSDLGFRVATLASTSKALPTLTGPGLLALLLGIALVGTIALRSRHARVKGVQ
jgi:hypothetical protein